MHARLNTHPFSCAKREGARFLGQHGVAAASFKGSVSRFRAPSRLHGGRHPATAAAALYLTAGEVESGKGEPFQVVYKGVPYPVASPEKYEVRFFQNGSNDEVYIALTNGRFAKFTKSSDAPPSVSRTNEGLILGDPRLSPVAVPSRLGVAQEFAAWVREQLGSRLVRVVLFGSVARGEDKEGSDVDLLVEVRGDPVEVRRLLGGRILEVAAKDGVFVSAFVRSVEPAGAGQAIGIYRVIEREGRVLG